MNAGNYCYKMPLEMKEDEEETEEASVKSE